MDILQYSQQIDKRFIRKFPNQNPNTISYNIRVLLIRIFLLVFKIKLFIAKSAFFNL